jgi:uncharacterized membrane protein
MTTNSEASTSLESHRRSLVKAVTWRVTGSIDTFLISWLVTGNPIIAGTISAIEIVTKVFLYYLHERVWGKIRWGKHA